MVYEVKKVSLSRVYLDNSNPRHDPIDNEPEIIAHLIAHEKVRNLASDISKRGTSPLERLAAVPHPDKSSFFVVAEGNRRVCALKLLNDPDKAPEAHRAYFRTLARKMSEIPKTLEVVAFENAKSARQWIELRHNGEQDGVGTKQWRAQQKTRFDQQGTSPTNPNSQSVELLDYAVREGLIAESDRSAISITTLTRFLSNPVFRHTLGLSNSKDLAIVVPQDEFDKGVRQFLVDAMSGKESGVHSRTTKQEREEYGRSLQKKGVAPISRLEAPVVLNQPAKVDDVGIKQATATASQKRENPSPDTRFKVIPASFKCKITNPVLKRVYDELKELESRYSFACAYLLRAVVEQTARLYLRKKGKAFEADLHVLVGRVADTLVADGVSAPRVKYLRVMANDRDSRGSPETLGAFVHGSQIPTSVDLAKAWDNLSDILTLLFAEIE